MSWVVRRHAAASPFSLIPLVCLALWKTVECQRYKNETDTTLA
jgi:hypothetical protein